MIYRVMFMKKMKKIVVVIFSAVFGIFCLSEPEMAKNAVIEGICRCLRTVIPSLYAMMIASGLLISTGAVSAAGRLFHRIARLIFGMDGESFAVFLFSMIAGYPVGARMICSRYRSNGCSADHAVLCSGLCFGAGSAFIYGCAASQRSFGGLILLSNISANLILALLMSPLLRKQAPKSSGCSVLTFDTGILSDSVSAAGRAMGEICFAVTGFSVLTAMLRQLGVIRLAALIPEKLMGFAPNTAETLICAALDVTAVSELPLGDLSLLPAISALVSFGGACVFMQIASIFRSDLTIAPLVLTRLVTAVVSGVICRLIMPFFLRAEVVSAAAMNPQFHRESSPIPSLMLALMTAALFAEMAKKRST